MGASAGRPMVRRRMLTPLIDGLGHATWSVDSASFSISNAVVLAKLLFIFQALVALQLLVSLISCVVACSARIETDRQTDRHTDQVL